MTNITHNSLFESLKADILLEHIHTRQLDFAKAWLSDTEI